MRRLRAPLTLGLLIAARGAAFDVATCGRLLPEDTTAVLQKRLYATNVTLRGNPPTGLLQQQPPRAVLSRSRRSP